MGCLAYLFGLAIGGLIRLLIWATITISRGAYRLVTRHPIFAVLLWLAVGAQGWTSERLFLAVLTALTLWAVVSFASDHWGAPKRRRVRRPARGTTQVSVGGGPWKTVPTLDPLDHLPRRERARWERARRRHEHQLASAGIGETYRARRSRRLRRRGVRR
jgi:hypothetical protein